jgi:aminoglycoside 6'-N-acetyltransferase I
MTSIKRCTSAEQAGWLALRMALWPAERHEHPEEMRERCAQTGRYAQFLAYSGLGEPQALVEIAMRSDDVNGAHSSPPGFLEGRLVASMRLDSKKWSIWSASESPATSKFVIKKTGKTCV